MSVAMFEVLIQLSSVGCETDVRALRMSGRSGNVIETHQKGTNLNKFRHQRKAKDNIIPLRFDQVVWSFTHLVS
jgi:hypothetical protein